MALSRGLIKNSPLLHELLRHWQIWRKHTFQEPSSKEKDLGPFLPRRGSDSLMVRQYTRLFCINLFTTCSRPHHETIDLSVKYGSDRPG